jgi:hypothetical protein
VNGRCEVALKELVEQEPRQGGHPFSSWTCADLVRELAKKGFDAVSRETIRAHLHALGYRVLRPVLSIARIGGKRNWQITSTKGFFL